MSNMNERIVTFLAANGESSLLAITTHLGLSDEAAKYLLRDMRQSGIVRRRRHRNRYLFSASRHPTAPRPAGR